MKGQGTCGIDRWDGEGEGTGTAAAAAAAAGAGATVAAGVAVAVGSVERAGGCGSSRVGGFNLDV